jgi:acetylornithine deacetylase ArgE
MSLNPIQLLRDMIAIPSVNPMRLDPGLAVEKELVDYIENTLRREGIDCERQLVAEGRENLVAIVDGSVDRDGLMLNSHLDTVPVANMTIDPFDPVVRDERVFGRGACDAKGSIAAMLTALIHHSRQTARSRPVVFAAMVDEEYSFSGSWKLIEKDWPVSSCIVGEPTGLASIIAHKGITRWRVKVKGIAAHGAMPHLGRNAIYAGAHVGVALECFANQLANRAPHPLLGGPTLNVGRVSGGSSVNIVPDSCEFEIERRLLPGEEGRQAIRECEEFVRAECGEQVEFSFEDPYLVDPPLETAREAVIVSAVGAAHSAEFGSAGAIEGAYYGTDGSKLASVGIETVVCGPGNIAQAHTADEYIEIEQLERAVRLYRRLISDWCA